MSVAAEGGDARALRDRARAALNLGRYESALNDAGRAVSLEPAEPLGHALVAEALGALDRHAEARVAAERGIAVAPDSALLHAVRASALLAERRCDDALAAADEARRLDPALGWAHRLRARALLGLERHAPALEAAQHAVKLNPNDARAHALVGDVYLRAMGRQFTPHRENAALAEAAYRRSLALDPESAMTLNNLGVALLRQKRSHEATRAFRLALQRDPSLTIAKQNTRISVKAVLQGGVVILGAGALGAAKLGIVGLALARLAMHGASGLAAVGAAVLLAAAVGLAVARLWRRRKLQREDPQLWALYRQLERDKRKGLLPNRARTSRPENRGARGYLGWLRFDAEGRRQLVYAVLIGAGVVLGVADHVGGALGGGPPVRHPSPSLRVGAAAPAFAAVRHADGARVRSADLAGKVVVLDFWGTWCPACRYEAPLVQQLARDFAKDPVVVLALDQDAVGGPEPKADVAAFLERQALPDYPVAYPEGDVAERFGVQVFPTLYVIGKDGRIDFVGPGAVPGERLRAAVHAALEN